MKFDEYANICFYDIILHINFFLLNNFHWKVLHCNYFGQSMIIIEVIFAIKFFMLQIFVNVISVCEM